MKTTSSGYTGSRVKFATGNQEFKSNNNIWLDGITVSGKPEPPNLICLGKESKTTTNQRIAGQQINSSLAQGTTTVASSGANLSGHLNTYKRVEKRPKSTYMGRVSQIMCASKPAVGKNSGYVRFNQQS